MSSVYRPSTESGRSDRPGYVRILQAIGAAVVTGFALWFLFGIPAYLLFGIFFE